jgi:hypothetical protein
VRFSWLTPGTSSLGTKGGVDTVEVFAPHGKGRVIVGHFLGTGGYRKEVGTLSEEENRFQLEVLLKANE